MSGKGVASPPDSAGHASSRSREYRRRRARRLFLLVSLARDPPPLWYDYPDLGPGLPRPPDERVDPAMYRGLKPFPPSVLDRRRLGALLRRRGDSALLETLRALSSPSSFAAFFLKSPPPPPNRPRITHMAPHLWKELRASGSVIPSSPPRLPYSCALRLVPDRKDTSLARVIYPVCPLNDACIAPHPTPTPHLHTFIATVLDSQFAFTADLKGWFFALAIPPSVAARYFAVRRGGQWFGCVRGLLGWRWMPYIMASIAHHLLCDAAESEGGRGLTWIDNLTGLFGSMTAASSALSRLRLRCASLGATLHDVSPPSQRISVVGLEFDLICRRWRLASAWARRWIAAAAACDTARSLPLRRVWTLVGGCVWVAFAAMLPLTWVGESLRYVSTLAGRWQRGLVQLDELVAYPRRVRDVARAVATYLCRNPWRSLCTAVTRPVFSDACGAGGLGMLVPSRHGYLEASDVIHPAPHINVLESIAASIAVRSSYAPPRGSVVPVVVDSTVTGWQWHRGRGRPDDADAAFRRAYEWAAHHRVALAVFILPSADQPADSPSRRLSRSCRLLSFHPASALARAAPIGVGVWAAALIPPGWRAPIRAAEFHDSQLASHTLSNPPPAS